MSEAGPARAGCRTRSSSSSRAPWGARSTTGACSPRRSLGRRSRTSLQETISGIAVVKALRRSKSPSPARRFDGVNDDALPASRSSLVRANAAHARHRSPCCPRSVHADDHRRGRQSDPRRSGRPHAAGRLLHVLRHVRLPAHLPHLHHGLGGGAGAARRGLDAAHRRAALRGSGSIRRPRPDPAPVTRPCAARSSCATSPSSLRHRGCHRGARPAQDVDLQVPAGTRRLGVVGPVGSGKTHPRWR